MRPNIPLGPSLTTSKNPIMLRMFWGKSFGSIRYVTGGKQWQLRVACMVCGATLMLNMFRSPHGLRNFFQRPLTETNWNRLEHSPAGGGARESPNALIRDNQRTQTDGIQGPLCFRLLHHVMFIHIYIYVCLILFVIKVFVRACL